MKVSLFQWLIDMYLGMTATSILNNTTEVITFQRFRLARFRRHALTLTVLMQSTDSECAQYLHGMCCVELQPTDTSWPISLVRVLYVVLAGHLWRFNLDKNQSTTITPNFEFVIEFLQSIFFIIKFLKSSFGNRVCELSFCKLSHVFFATEFL